MTITVDYQGNLRCTATSNESTDPLTTDAPKKLGGKGEAISPTELVAAALGTCVMTMLGAVAQRSGLDLAGSQVQVEKEMSATPPSRISQMKVTIVLPPDKSISEADRQKLERAAQSCPVKQSLHPEINIAIQFVYPG